MTKRIIGLFLALCIVVGLLPMIALAADEKEPAAPAPATLVITTGNNDAKVQWKPTLSAGMAPAYAKTTAEGALVLEGTESDYNLKVEWPAEGKPTLTLNGATLANDTNSISGSGMANTIHIGGTESFEVLLKGTNNIKGALGIEDTTVANHRMPAGIYGENMGSLTIKSLNKTTDTLVIDNNGGLGLLKRYNALTIDSANITIYQETTSKNGQVAIVMATYGTAYADLTNLTVINSILTIKNNGRYYGNSFIIMGKEGASYSAENTGDILFKNSVINFNRNNGTSVNSSSGNAIQYSPKGSMTIDSCEFDIRGNHRTFNYAPTVINCDNVQCKTGWSDWKDWTVEPGTALTKNDNNSGLKGTHKCVYEGDDFDCTTANTCGICGKTQGTVQTAHTAAADDGDCTTAVLCANEGCKKVVIEAKAAHVAEADDKDCATATKCANCETIMVPAAEHKPADRANCEVAANCTVCGKEVLKAGEHTGGEATCVAKAKCTACGLEYGELGNHKGGTATCTEQAKCELCQTAYGELAAHTGGTATCTEQAKCEKCQAAYGELAAHTAEPDDDDCTTAIKCSVCGGEAVAAKTHTYTNGVDTTCDNAGCKFERVIAPKPEFKLSFATAKGGGVPSSTGSATIKMKAGDPAKYYITGNFDASAPKDYFCQELKDAAKIAAGEWNIKVEYEADGIPTVTLKKAFIQNKGALQFGGWYAPYEGPTKLIIEEDSIINSGYGYKSTLRFTTTGQNDDVTITSVNGAKLTLISNTLAKDEGAIKACGNLTLDNANIECILTEYNGVANGICVAGGNLTIKGGTLKIHAWDDPNKTGTQKEGEEANYLLNANACYAGFKVTKDAENEAKAGNVTIEGGADVYLAISVSSASADADKRLIATDGIFTIKDSTVEMGLIGKCVDGAKLFLVKPTLEFAEGYTVLATKTTKPSVTATAHELDQWARTIVMTPKAGKEVNWDETTSLGSITYFKVTAGGNGGTTPTPGGNGGTTPGGNTPSNPNTGDISILLTAAVALSSAVGFAGVTVLRKKEN